jgi:hypothetical protein
LITTPYRAPTATPIAAEPPKKRKTHDFAVNPL